MSKSKCKEHKWRVGSTIAKFRLKKITNVGINIWCEDCKEKLVAKYQPYGSPSMLPFKSKFYKPKIINTSKTLKGGIENAHI